MASSWWQDEANIAAIRDCALQSGLLLKRTGDPKDDSCVQISVTLSASKFPEELFHLAYDIQSDINSVVDEISCDHEFLTNALGSVIKSDDYTRRLFEIYEEVRHNNKQTCRLGVHRSDYMVDSCAVAMETKPDRTPAELCLRQIEINTIASSFYGLTSRLRDFHEYVHSRYYSSEQLKLPENTCLYSIVDAVACAWREYGKQSSHVLTVHQTGERNVFDQRPLELELWKRYRIPVMRRTLTELSQEASLGPDRELFVSGSEIAVVYYRAGYTPRDYPSDKEWNARRILELSRASNCPSVAYQLVGTKKMQQALAEPGALERHVKDPTAAKKIRSTFAGLYSLDMTPAGDRAVEMAMRDPEKFVIKPQREGGGNNVYGEDVRTLLHQIGSSPQREAYILMDRVNPSSQQGIILRPGMFRVDPLPLISELGIFGVYVRKGDDVLLNSGGGHILRTKTVTSDEGGVAMGAGSLDSPNLVPSSDFLKLVS